MSVRERDGFVCTRDLERQLRKADPNCKKRSFHKWKRTVRGKRAIEDLCKRLGVPQDEIVKVCGWPVRF